MAKPKLIRRPSRAGFTLIEMLTASAIMLIVVVGALSIYVRSNQTAADEQQYTRVQQDVRACMYYLARDIRMIGAGLPSNYLGYSFEGTDNEDAGGSVRPDRLRVAGNLTNPFYVNIASSNGSKTQVTFEDYALDRFCYPDSFYVGKIVFILPNPSSTCTGAATRMITSVKHTSTAPTFSFNPGQAKGINIPGGLKDICADGEFLGGSILLADFHEYFLDVTGSYPGLTAGQNGYIGGGAGGILYMINNGTYFPLAENIENIQLQYNGNFDGDASGSLDGFQNWSTSWTPAMASRIRQIRVQILGRTPDRFVRIPSRTSRNTSLYRRPTMANSAAATADDGRKRFLLESTVNIRNLSIAIAAGT
jgi:prepilin-type N-terminal cleavage/methylation domain-containing protein